MITLMDALRFHAHILSQEIFRIKKDAFKTEKAKKWVFVNAKTGEAYGASTASIPKDVKIENVQWKETEYTQVVDHINPEHPYWRQYTGRKHEVTCLMIAIRIAKVPGWDAEYGIDFCKIVDAAAAACLVCKKYRIGTIMARMKSLKEKIAKGKYHHNAEVEAWLAEARKHEEVAVA